MGWGGFVTSGRLISRSTKQVLLCITEIRMIHWELGSPPGGAFVSLNKTSAFVHHRDKNDPLSSGLGDTLVWLCSLDKNNNIGSTDSLAL